MYKKVEMLTNLLMIVVAVLIGAVLAKHYLFADASGGSRRAAIKEVSAGSKISMSDVDWEKNGKTLLLALAPGCHFCSESAPFYQRLVREAAAIPKIRLIGVFPTPDSENRKYLKELGVEINEVREVSPDSIGITGTPTLILVNQAGVVTRVWIGQLPPAEEAEVLSELHEPCDCD